MYLDHLEAQVAFVEHDNFIFICSFIYHVSQSEQLLPVGQDCTAPGWVPLVTNHNLFLKGLDRLVQDCGVLVLIWACELVLVMQEKALKRSGTFVKTQKLLTVNKVRASKQLRAGPFQVTWHLIKCLLGGSFNSNIERYNFGFIVTCSDLTTTLDKDTWRMPPYPFFFFFLNEVWNYGRQSFWGSWREISPRAVHSSCGNSSFYSQNPTNNSTNWESISKHHNTETSSSSTMASDNIIKLLCKRIRYKFTAVQ